MKYCRSCGIFFQVPINKCMFCNNETDERVVPEKLAYYESIKEQENRYTPVLKEKVLKKKLFKLLCFLLMVAAGFCLYFDFVEEKPYALTWSIIMVASGIYLIMIIRILFGRLIKPKKFIYFVLTTAFELAAIGIGIRDMQWVYDFIIPFYIMICVAFASLLLFSGKRRIYDYAIYVFNLSLLGFIPFFLLVFGVINITWPSLAAALYCLITLLGLMFFSGRKFFEELKRRIHV